MKYYLFPIYFIDDLFLILRNRIHYHFHLEPSKKWKTGNKGDVILIQGHNARWVSLEKIGSALYRQGYRIHIVKKLKNNLESISKGSADIAEYIKVNDFKNIILIGHSKGAINAIYLLKDPEIEKRIKKIISIAGPFKGTLLGKFTSNTKDLRPESDFIKKYSKGINSNKIINLYPLVDDMVIPNKSLYWDGVINRQINIFGHIRIVESKKTIKEIILILKSL